MLSTKKMQLIELETAFID